MKALTLSILVFSLNIAVAAAQVTVPPILKNVSFDQRLNEQVPLNLAFRDESGKRVLLQDYFHGKPVILVLAYYRCPMLCNLVLNGLTQAMCDLSFDLGQGVQRGDGELRPARNCRLGRREKGNLCRARMAGRVPPRAGTS